MNDTPELITVTPTPVVSPEAGGPLHPDRLAIAQSRNALRHVLRRIAHEKPVGELLGYATESFALISEALATIEGRDLYPFREEWLPGSASIYDRRDTIPEKTIAGPINLGPFLSRCSERSNLWRPWLQGGYLYATDGRVLLRVLPDGYDAGALNPRPEIDGLKFFAWDHAHLPPDGWHSPTKEMSDYHPKPCLNCDGKGVRNCCECAYLRACPECEGEGVIYETRSLGLLQFGLNCFYIHRLMRLSGLQFHVTPEGNSSNPVPFRFDQGTGYLMPMR